MPTLAGNGGPSGNTGGYRTAVSISQFLSKNAVSAFWKFSVLAAFGSLHPVIVITIATAGTRRLTMIRAGIGVRSSIIMGLALIATMGWDPDVRPVTPDVAALDGRGGLDGPLGVSGGIQTQLAPWRAQ